MMEPLWSPVVATGGNRWQIGAARKPPNQAKTVAVDCDRLPIGAHGKEGVDGSSPSEGSAKAPHTGLFFSAQLAARPTWSRYGALYGAFSSKSVGQKVPFGQDGAPGASKLTDAFMQTRPLAHRRRRGAMTAEPSITAQSGI